MNGIRKHRGLRRYYRNLATKNEFANNAQSIDVENPETWFNYWHRHFDNHGYGNSSFKRRKPHLDKLFRHFDILVDKTEKLKTDFQLYAIVLDYHSVSDALFFHAPNNDNSLFPFDVSNLVETSTLINKELDVYLDQLTDYKKLYGEAEENFCILYKDGVGVPLLS